MPRGREALVRKSSRNGQYSPGWIRYSDPGPAARTVGLDGGVDDPHLFMAGPEVGETDFESSALALGRDGFVEIPEEVVYGVMVAHRVPRGQGGVTGRIRRLQAQLVEPRSAVAVADP